MQNAQSQLKIGIVLNYVNLALGGLIPFIYTPIMLRLLGQEEYGLYKLSGSVTSYLSLMSLGLGAAITRYLIKAREESGQAEEQKILGLFVMIFWLISALTLLVGMLLSVNVGHWYSSSLTQEEMDKMGILVFILTLNTAVNFIATPYISVVNSHERFLFLQGMNIFSTCAGPILNLIALFLGYASIGLAVSSLIATVFFRVFYYCYVNRCMRIKPIFAKVEKALVAEILIFSFWIFVSNVVGQLYDATSTILIGAIPTLATVGVAIYNIGITFNGMIFTINAGISSLLLPKANKMVFSGATNEELTAEALKFGRLQCLVISLFAFGFVAFGRPFIHFYVGDDYQEAYWIAVLCMIPNIIPLVQSFFLNILIAKNHNRFRALTYLVIAIVNVVGTWILLHVVGIVGAAIMMGLSLILGNGFFMNWYYSRKLGLGVGRFWKGILQTLIAPVLLCLFFLVLGMFANFYRIPYFLLGIAFFVIVYSLTNWYLVLNHYEKMLVMQPLRKVFIRRLRN